MRKKSTYTKKIDASNAIVAAHLTEFKSLRDEMNNRVVIQNGMIERGLQIAGITTVFVGAMYGAIGKGDTKDAFVGVVFGTLVVYGLLEQLILCNWVYQLAMILRLSLYICWVGSLAIWGGEKSESVFALDRGSVSQPWDKIMDGLHFGVLQIGPLVLLCFLAPVGLTILHFSRGSQFGWWIVLSAVVLFCTAVLAFLVNVLNSRTASRKRLGLRFFGSGRTLEAKPWMAGFDCEDVSITDC